MSVNYLDLKNLISDYHFKLDFIVDCYNLSMKELIDNNEIDLNKLEEEFDEEFYFINSKEIQFNLLDIYSLLKQNHHNEDYYQILTLTERGDTYCNDYYTLKNRYTIPVSIFYIDNSEIKNTLKKYLKNMYSVTIKNNQNEEE